MSILGPNGQYLVRRSSKVRGMVRVQSNRSDRARLAMNTFCDVSITCTDFIFRANKTQVKSVKLGKTLDLNL